MVTLYGTVLKSYCTNTVTSISYRELRLKVLQVLSSGEWYNIPYLAKLLNIDRANLHKIIRPLLRKGIIVKRKANGLTWIRLAHKQLFEEAHHKVDLILKTRVSQTPTRPNKRYVRANPYRLQALKVLANVNVLDGETWSTLNYLFNAYMEDISRRAIILKHISNDSWLWLPYRTRFSKTGIKKLLRKFSIAFNNTNRFTYALWITLTFDPKMFNNIIEMRYESQKAFNRLMSYIARLLGFRPKYIRVIEFTTEKKTGLIHYHIILLGVRRLLPKDYWEARLPNGKTLWGSTYNELVMRIKQYGFSPNDCKIIKHDKSLTAFLQQWGFGYISYISLIVNRNGRWVSKKLLKAEKGYFDGGGLVYNLKGYLSKYLTKALKNVDFDEGYPQVDENGINPIVLYWALNSRFFTCSLDLLPHSDYHRSYEWEFWGSGYLYNSIDYPLETDYPPWEYYVPWTYPPLYHVPEV